MKFQNTRHGDFIACPSILYTSVATVCRSITRSIKQSIIKSFPSKPPSTPVQMGQRHYKTPLFASSIPHPGAKLFVSYSFGILHLMFNGNHRPASAQSTNILKSIKRDFMSNIFPQSQAAQQGQCQTSYSKHLKPLKRTFQSASGRLSSSR